MTPISTCWNGSGTATGRPSPRSWSAISGPLYNAAFWVLRRAEDANDVTQIVFLKIAEQLDEYDPRYKFFSWIYRITVNESLNLLRRNRRKRPLDDEVELAGLRAQQPGIAIRRSRGCQSGSGAR